MSLTEKGRVAFDYARKYFPEGWFSAAELSAKCGEKIAAATLNGIVNRGYMEKMAGTPVKFALVDDIDGLVISEEPAGCDNTNLTRAKRVKNDEFYTRLDDINKELINYRKFFKRKSILCNCNDGENSQFFQFFLKNFDAFQLESLTAIEYVKGGHGIKRVIRDDLNKDGYIDIEDVEVTELNDDGGFATAEVVEELKNCDIVCTNPPFSLFRDYMDLLMQYNKQFIIIGSKNAITYKEFFPLLKDNKVWIGMNNVGNFVQPDGTIAKFGNIGWYTNLPHPKHEEPLLLTATYYNDTNRREEYPFYDNYDAIEVSRVANIPKDYEGVMGVPITFLDKYCPEQFEIVGWSRHNDLNMDGGYWHAGTCADATINGKQVYRRILIKRK
jgi:hypothetical protein